MLAVLYASLAALSYGASDYSGAVAAKNTDSTLVTVAAQAASLATLALILVLFPEDQRALVDLAWGALGGLAAAVGLVAFYRALAIGPMSTAASTTSLLSAVVPVVVGLALGERPGTITMVGVAVAIPAGVLVSVGGTVFRRERIALSPREHVTSRRGEGETRALSIVAGLCFGLFFIALSRVSPDAGLFPLVGARGASITALALFITLRKGWAPIAGDSRRSIVVAGVLDCAANSCYLLALGEGSFVWVAAITSMSPVSTVLLARIRLHELMTRTQILGIAGAILAVVLVSVGAEL